MATDAATALDGVIRHFGRQLLDHPERLRNALADVLSSTDRPGIEELMAAAITGVATGLDTVPEDVPASEAQVREWFDRLVASGLSPQDAAWATTVWAQVLAPADRAREVSEISRTLTVPTTPDTSAAEQAESVVRDGLGALTEVSRLDGLGDETVRATRDCARTGGADRHRAEEQSQPEDAGERVVSAGEERERIGRDGEQENTDSHEPPPHPDDAGSRTTAALLRAWWPAAAGAVMLIMAAAIWSPLIASASAPVEPRGENVRSAPWKPVVRSSDLDGLILPSDLLDELVPSPTYRWGPANTPDAPITATLGWMAALTGECAALITVLPGTGDGAEDSVHGSMRFSDAGSVNTFGRAFSGRSEAALAWHDLDPDCHSFTLRDANGTAFTGTAEKLATDSGHTVENLGWGYFHIRVTLQLQEPYLIERWCGVVDRLVVCHTALGEGTAFSTHHPEVPAFALTQLKRYRTFLPEDAS